MGFFQPEIFIEGLSGVPVYFHLIGFFVVVFGVVASNNPATIIGVIPMLFILSMMGHMIKLGGERDAWSSLAEGNRYIVEKYQGCREPGLFQNGSKLECSEMLFKAAARDEILGEKEIKQLIDHWEAKLSIHSRFNSDRLGRKAENTDHLTREESLSKITKRSVNEIHAEKQKLIDKGLIYPDDNREGVSVDVVNQK